MSGTPSGLVILLWTTLAAIPTPAAAITDNGQVVQVVAVLGSHADLPCDTAASDPADQLTLVLWFKDNENTPIYSFYARGGKLFSARPADGEPERHVIFVTHTEVSALRLASVTALDQGLYRCRVDFRDGQTTNHRLNLTVIIPPGKPIILYNARSVTGRIGPLREDEPLELVCLSQGGWPPPRVRWFRDTSLLDGTDRPVGPGQIANELRLPPLSRPDLHSRLICAASNNNDSQPATNDVQLAIYFRPLGVEIIGSERLSVSAGKTYHLVCRTFGSRPAANITWLIGDKRLSGDTQTVSDDGNTTISKLRLQPRIADVDKQLVCRAENSLVTDGVLEHRRPLYVRYPPVVSLKLGSALRPDDIMEGADVSFECTIAAKPATYNVFWFHDGKGLESRIDEARPSDRVDTMDRSLIIRNVSRLSNGAYVCKASNSEGYGASRPVMLNIKYAPVCSSGQRIRYGSTCAQPVNVTCKLDANPSEVTFKWQFSNSRRTFDFPSSQICSRGLTSYVTFTPPDETDSGTMLCWAVNEIGRMVQPCVFQLAITGRPNPMRNCTIINQTSLLLEVECLAGFDGGLPQYFMAALFNVADEQLLQNHTRPFPDFVFSELPEDLELRLELYAANSCGRSQVTKLQGFTLKKPEKGANQDDRKPPPKSQFMVTPMLGVLIGLVATLIILAIVTAVCIRNKSIRSREATARLDQGITTVLWKTNAETVPVRVKSLTSDITKAFDADRLSPEVVPNMNDPACEVAEGTIMLNHLTSEVKVENASESELEKSARMKATSYEGTVLRRSTLKNKLEAVE